MSKKNKITESGLTALGYVKNNETEKHILYVLDENIFDNEYGFSCDSIFDTNIILYNNGLCVIGGECEIEDFNDVRDILYKTLYTNGIKDVVNQG
jgi:hypothetical protein